MNSTIDSVLVTNKKKAMCRHDMTLLSQQKALVLWGVLGNKPWLHYNTSQLLNPLHSQSALKCSCGKMERGVTSWTLMNFRKTNKRSIMKLELSVCCWVHEVRKLHMNESVKYIPPGKVRPGRGSTKAHLAPRFMLALPGVFHHSYSTPCPPLTLLTSLTLT